MSIHFATEMTVFQYSSDGTSIKLCQSVIFAHPSRPIPPTLELPKPLSELDIMRRFIMQLANQSPSLFIEEAIHDDFGQTPPEPPDDLDDDSDDKSDDKSDSLSSDHSSSEEEEWYESDSSEEDDNTSHAILFNKQQVETGSICTVNLLNLILTDKSGENK